MTFGGHGMMMGGEAGLQPLMALAHTGSPYLSIYNTLTRTKLPNPSVLPAGGGTWAAFSPDNGKLAVSHSGWPYLTIYNTSDWSTLPNPSVLPAGSGGVAWSPDGSKLAVAHGGSPYLTIYNTADWSKIANPATLPTGNANSAHFSSDGTMLLVANFAGAGNNNIIIYNVANWTTRSAPNPGNFGYNGVGAYAARFSPDSAMIACAGDGGVLVYRLSDNANLVYLSAIGADAYHVTFSSDGLWLCCGTATGGGRDAPVYRVSDWALVHNAHAGGSTCEFSHDASVLAVGSDYGFASVNTSTWATMPALDTQPAGQVTRIAFNSIG